MTKVFEQILESNTLSIISFCLFPFKGDSEGNLTGLSISLSIGNYSDVFQGSSRMG